MRLPPPFGGLLVALMLLSAAACATISDREPYTLDELLDSRIAGLDDLRFFAKGGVQLQSVLGLNQQGGPYPLKIEGGRFDILALSSGGPDGAYGAGALKGMTQSGTRPVYEIVTGVSTGALIAPFAFVGAKYDTLLESIYTGGDLNRVLGRPSVLAAASGPALYPANRIPKFMSQHVDAALLEDIAAAHETGRRLLIATANLDADQLTVWNMGRIAQLGGPQGLNLFHSVLRAAIAIPGALAPVEITSRAGDREIVELHGDAGVLSYFYADPDLVPRQLTRRRGTDRPRIDVILHNQIEAPTEPVKARTITLAGKSVSNLARTAMRLLLDNTIENADKSGIAVRYAYVPTNWQTVTSLDFNPQYMRRTFDLGYRQAVSNSLWNTGAPGN